MNFSLLEHIEHINNAILVTVLSTEGHSYKKRGDKALYAAGNPFPIYGNLGTTCVDPHILDVGVAALRDGKPRQITVDTTDPTDALIGTGTFCGGRIELLVEPLFDEQKEIYRQLRLSLENDRDIHVIHDLATGDLALSNSPESREECYVETVRPAPRLWIFGATPLTKHVVRLLDESDFSIHVSDWRESYLATLSDLPRVRCHLDDWDVDAQAYVLVMSHSHEHDLRTLRDTLQRECRFIGVLSSTSRRDAILAQLSDEGFSNERLSRVFSPVGLRIGGRSDTEIAVSIIAQLIQVKNQ